MYPYFAAAADNLSIEFAYLFSQQMEERRATHTEVYGRFIGGFYVMRYNDSYSMDLSTGLAIVQVLMRIINII